MKIIKEKGLLISIILTVINFIMPSVLGKVIDNDVLSTVVIIIMLLLGIISLLFQILYLNKDFMKYVGEVVKFFIKGGWKIGQAFGKIFIFIPAIGILLGAVLGYIIAVLMAIGGAMFGLFVLVICLLSLPILTVVLHNKVVK